jgi:hypothetical protein
MDPKMGRTDVKASDAVALYLARDSISKSYEVAGGMIAHQLESL